MVPTSLLFLMWIKTIKCLVRINLNFIPSVSTGFVEFEYIAHKITSYVIEHCFNNLLCLFSACYMNGSRKSRHGDPEIFLSHQRISQRAVRTSLEKQLDPLRQVCTSISKET